MWTSRRARRDIKEQPSQAYRVGGQHVDASWVRAEIGGDQRSTTCRVDVGTEQRIAGEDIRRSRRENVGDGKIDVVAAGRDAEGEAADIHCRRTRVEQSHFQRIVAAAGI